ncbi:unnamed protein product [Lactuca saligna]|uniref:Uncharacterized protein n=1 Tax=Lactuca saligna TaxID=75948 RepID=A0AA35YT36_LACSI|nr:unnamed protein product [Lactuca saligna]
MVDIVKGGHMEIQMSKQEESSLPPIVTKKPEETFLPYQTGVLKKLKKNTHPSSPAYTVKPQITRKGVIFRAVQEHVSPASKKRQAEDMAKHISKKQRKKLQKCVIKDDSTEDEVIPKTPISITSTVATIFHVIMTIEPSQVSTQTPIVLTPPVVSDVETTHPQGTSHTIVSSTFETSTIDTSTTLPPFVSTPIDTHSPTFDNILDQPITSLFSSQSTKPPVTHEETQTPTDDDENFFDDTFDDIQWQL